jgi:hypothetical protein
MGISVSDNSDDARRARRLLRWYPVAWRERYGEEFVDHLEQEFADRTTDLRRSVNIIRKGLVARVGDLGLSNSGVNNGSQARAALGTSVALIALMVVVMLNFWSRAMGAWSGRIYHPIPVSATTGVLTVALGLLVVLLAVIVVGMAILAGRQILRRRAVGLVGPSILAVVSGAFLLYEARDFPGFLAPYVDGAHGIRQLSLSNPGGSLANFATVLWELTQRWVGPWRQGFSDFSTIHAVVDDCVPLAMFLFGVSIALLIRRVELPRSSSRFVFPALALLGTLGGAFFVAYIAWSAFGGPSNYEYFFPESPWLGVVYLILMALIPSLVLRSGVVAVKSRPRNLRNRIEMVPS